MSGFLDPAVWIVATVEWNGQRLQATQPVDRYIYDNDKVMVDIIKKDLRQKLAEEIMNRMTVHYHTQ